MSRLVDWLVHLLESQDDTYRTEVNHSSLGANEIISAVFLVDLQLSSLLPTLERLSFKLKIPLNLKISLSIILF